jgi:autotransporter-associated beta strand protein
MNRVYSLVWNRALHSVQVASELASSTGGGNVASGAASSPVRRHPLALACAAALALGAFAPPAWSATCAVGATPVAVGAPVNGPAGANGSAGTSGTGTYSGDGDPGTGGGSGGAGSGGASATGPGTFCVDTSFASGNGGNGGDGGYGGSGLGGTFLNAQAGFGGTGGNGAVGGVGGTGLNGSASPTVTVLDGIDVTGGAGGAGGSGGDGGAGGAASNGAIAGLGGNGGNGAAGGAGGLGASFGVGSSVANYGSITGGAGGAGGSGGSGGANGSITGGGTAVPTHSTGGNAGGGGAGGAGVYGSGLTLLNHGVITGGAGGYGGTGGATGNGAVPPNVGAGQSGVGGAGGDGVDGSGLTLTNFGSIQGGGVGDNGSQQFATPAGGRGINASGNSTVVNAAGGSIAGYMNFATNQRADAVDFSGGGNTLTLEVGSSVSGNIKSSSGTTNGDTLILGDSASGGGSATLAINTVSGFAQYDKTGTSTWTLTGADGDAGGWDIKAGKLIVGASGASASLAGPATVENGAMLGGYGMVGATTVKSGGTLAPGSATSLGATGTFGTLTVNGDLVLQSGSIIDLNLGAPATTPVNGDHINVTGGLTMSGTTLNVGNVNNSVGPGLYKVIAYASTAPEVAGGLSVASTASAGQNYSIQYTAGQVNLLDAPNTIAFWAPAPVSPSKFGGIGTWTAASASWTDSTGTAALAKMDPVPGFAEFQGTSGTVTVDSSAGSGGAVSVTGMQFFVSGYTVTGNAPGDAITLVGTPGGGTTAAPIINVGDGTSGSAGTTATINAVLTGGDGLTKTDYGTLVLGGANTFTGQVTVGGGTLSVANEGNLGGASNPVTLDGGTLENTASFTLGNALVAGDAGATLQTDAGTNLTVSNTITGTGAFTQTGTGTLTLDGDVLAQGAQTFNGAVALGNDVTLATLDGAVAFGGTVANATAGTPEALTISAGSGAVNFDGAVGTASDPLGALTSSSGSFVAGALAIGSGGLAVTTTMGGITQGGAWSVAGSSTLATGANAITLASVGNDFAGAVSLYNSGANDVVLNNGSNALTLGASAVGTGTLTVTGGAITQTGAITQAAGAGTATFDAGTHALALGNAGNDFTGTVDLTGGATQIASSGNLTLGTLDTAALTASSGGALVFGGSGTVAGVLTAGSTAATPSIVVDGVLTGLTGAAFSGSAPTGTGSLIGAGAITGLGSTTFDLTGTQAGTAGGIGFSGFTSADTTTVAGAPGFDLSTKITDGIAFANATSVSGTGTLTGANATYDLVGVNAGSSGAVSWSGFGSIVDATGMVDLGAAGSLSGSVAARTLRGDGAVGGNVEITQGGALSPGAGTGSIGTLAIGGNLTLDQGTTLDVDLGAPGTPNPFTTVGTSDRVDVVGTLTFDGGSTLNLAATGSAGPGLYNLASYGTLAATGCAFNGGTACLTLGTLPSGTQASYYTLVNNSADSQIDLYNTAGQVLDIWAPNGAANLGGTGTWSATSLTWTDTNGGTPSTMFPAPGFAIFQGTPGTVTVSAADGSVVATGLQFAVDGYTLAGDPLTLVDDSSGNAPVIEVGDGSANSASMTATIGSQLLGSGFTKIGAGTLAFVGANNLALGPSGVERVAVQGGTLQIGSATAPLQGTPGTGGALMATTVMAPGTSLSLINGELSGGGTSADSAAVTGQDFSVTTQTTSAGASIILGIFATAPGSQPLRGAGAAINGDGFTATFTGNTAVLGAGAISTGYASFDTPAITGSDFHVVNDSNVGTLVSPGLGVPFGMRYGITGGAALGNATGVAGAGGAGVAGTRFTVENSGGIYGGAGGGTVSGTPGTGGAGISGTGFTLTNTGNITGGAGGQVIAGGGYAGTGVVTAAGGAGVSSLGGATVINAGTISGGQSGAGLAPADAIDFTGGGNTLELVAGQPGTFNGAVVATRAAGDPADTLALGGDSGTDTFDVSQLASGGKFGDFNAEAKSDAATWTLTGAGSSVENWTVADGALNGDATALQGNVTFTPVAGETATVVFDQGGGNANSTPNGTFAGVIAGAGDLVKTGDGTLVLTGANTFTGGTTIGAGTLQVGNGGTTGTIGSGAITDNGTLVFDRSDAVVLSAGLTGGGALVQQGSGTLLVNGDDSGFAGTTTLMAGTATVGDDAHPAASLGGVVDVAAGATLTGIGTLGGLDLSGTLSPGGSIGTLHVAGDATFEAGSTFNVEADPNGTADQLAVTGKTTIKGGNTVVLAQPGNWAPSTRYTIITSGGGVTGTFAGVSDDQAFLTPTLAYGANDVTLTLSRNQVAFPSVGTTPNQKGVATAIEGLGAGNALYDAVVKLNAADAQVAFDQTSGEYHASEQTARIDDSRYIREAMNQRLRAGDADPEATRVGSLTAWAHAWGHWGTIDGDDNTSRLADNGNGLLVGADLPVATNARVGVTGGASRSSVSARDRDSWGRDSSMWLGAYGDLDFNAFGLRGGIAYAWNQMPINRLIAFPGYADRLGGNATGHTLTGFVEGAWTFHFTNGTIAPFLNLAHAQVTTGTSTEQGGAAALHAHGASENVSFSTLGARGQVDLANHLNLHGELGWQHAFGDTTPEQNLSFAAGGPAFTTHGVPIAKDAGVGRIGLGWQHGNIAISADYEGLVGNGAKDQAARLSVGVRF